MENVCALNISLSNQRLYLILFFIMFLSSVPSIRTCTSWQMVLYLYLLSKIVKLVIFTFCFVCTGYIRIYVVLNAYVDLVTSNLWTIFWYTTYFHSFSYYVVVSSGETYHWCCNVSCVYIDSILQCLFITWFFFFFWFVFRFIIIFLVTLLWYSKLYSQRTCLLGQPQLGLEEYLCLKCVCVCVTVCSSYCFINSFRSQMQLREDKIKKHRKQSSYS